MSFLPLFTAPNLTVAELTLGEPAAFDMPDESNWALRMPKDARRAKMLKPDCKWNIYSVVGGRAPNLRISKDNPAKVIHAFAADYDASLPLEQVGSLLGTLPEGQQPHWLERTLGKKWRVLWRLERPILVNGNEHCQAVLKTFFDKLHAETLLPGFDEASYKPAEMWTNGGRWVDLQDPMVPLSKEFIFGVLCAVAKQTQLFEHSDIPLEVISAEVEARFPGRWQGDFKIDAQGIRFWDEKADCPTGCQVKPDGMLCFTGTEPFQKWEAIFGRQWVEEQRVLSLGKAGEGIWFDGKNYWEALAGKWESVCRADAVLRLKGRGMSDKCAKGDTQSMLERVLDHIQTTNRIQGAAPFVNEPPGILDTPHGRVLNTASLCPVQPVQGPSGTPDDFPWLAKYFAGFFPRADLLPLEHFFEWLKRGYKNVLYYQKFMGQAVFVCGPRNNGKTLLCFRILCPMFGGKVANPIDYMTGETSFNDDLFEAALLAVNDEDAPGNEARRQRMLAKLKGLVVNPMHRHNAKFDKRVIVDWIGRIFITLNDDPGSVGMLLEVSHNTEDKQMMFASQPYDGVFPPQDELEAIIARELPYFCWWLLNVYKSPECVLSDDRMGVKSYFDPHILELANKTTFASNLAELIEVWQVSDAYWTEGNDHEFWEGTPTGLLTALQTNVDTQGIAREWSQQRITKSLTVLAKQADSGIAFAATAGNRQFHIDRIIPTNT